MVAASGADGTAPSETLGQRHLACKNSIEFRAFLALIIQDFARITWSLPASRDPLLTGTVGQGHCSLPSQAQGFVEQR